ncbi:MAG: site-specific integrase [Gemmatimonadetes bacterium]|nr:site-specific integrase [Gemmatimonadota bacterium]
MLDHCIKNRDTVRQLRSGVIGSQLDSFATHLAEDGYAATTVRAQFTVLGHFSQWLTRRACGMHELTDEWVATFIKHRKRRGGLRRGDAATLHQFLAHLRARGVVASAAPVVDESPVSQLLRHYEQHLRAERGLAPATVTNYVGMFRWFLTDRFGDGPLDLRALDVASITTFVIGHAHTMSPGRAKGMVTALRSICHFLLQRGAIDHDLAAGVPRMPDWRLATIPKYLSPEEIARLLQACDLEAGIGRRDHAILLLLARLGLRAGEIVALALDDIQWRAGAILVRSSKRLPQDRLPLLAEVGEALATYLQRDRPTHLTTRQVFVCTRAPRRGFTNPSTVSTIVRRALARAGLSPALKGAHLLRHSLATQMLRHGASLPEIGIVLRHRAVQTTEIYAKVDLAGLRALAQPWPPMGGAQ